jgi:uncharacterized repeat protein (TIGR02543 family)
VASSGIGAKAKSRYVEGKGEVTIDGSLSAATPFVVVGTTDKTTADITEPTTKADHLTYSDGVHSVWIGSVGNPVITAPTAPQNFTATPGDGQVALSWTAPVSDGGSDVTGYLVSKDNGANWANVGLSTSHTFTGLTNDTAYTFKVRAVNSAGNGAAASATATPAVYVCEIGVAKYATLDAALAAVTSGQTIKLLNSITHTSPIEVDGKTIYFELGNYNLLVDTSDYSGVSIDSVLTVNNGGKLKLTGAGAGKFNVKSTSNSHEYGIRVLDANSEVTVNNVNVTGESATGVYAKGGIVVINGDITAGHRGVVTAVVDGTSVTVNGNITVLGNASEGRGICADEKTTVCVTGDVTGQGTDCIGVFADGGTIQVGGDVASSGIGAKAKSRYSEGKGEVTIDGSLSAATPFVVVGTTDKTTTDITEPTTKTGFLTYSDGVNSVWIGSVGNSGITAPTAPQNFTATPGDGQVALSWTAPVSDGGSDVTGYLVSKDNGANWANVGLSTSHTFTGLTNDTAYTFKVRAVNSAGNGAAASATATPVAPTKPWHLYTWGGNGDGQLGDGTQQNKSTPTHIGTAEDWTTVSAGGMHTVALKSTGSLWTWGSNSYGQLGDGTSESTKDSPVHIGSDYDWAAIETGGYHTVALKTDGSLWAWGCNNIGQLGDGTTENKNVPTQIAAGSTWIAVSAGRQHTVAIKSDGSLWAWGANSNGELGDGSTDFKKVPTQISTEQWALVSAGTSFTVALKADGSLWTWGRNHVGQLGDGTVVDKNVPTRVGADTWLAAAAGDNHVVAIKSGGSLWAWGGNEYGELGTGSYDSVVDPSAHPVPTQIGTDTDWISVTTSYAHNAAFRTDGSLWLWGLNGTGQLGDGTSGNGAVSPQRLDGTGTWLTVSCGGSHTAAVMEAEPTAPTAPRDFTATPGDGQVALSWTAPVSDGGAAITKYQVSKDNGANWTDVALNTSHTFTGLTNGTECTFKVRAVNSVGNGAEASVAATPTANVCKIGATEYAALDNALAALVDNTPTTITLLQNITDTDGISLSRKKLTIDLNGKTLTVNNSTGIGIEMELSSELNITGPGNLNVCGMTGLYLNQSIFAAAENVMVDITSDDGFGLGTDTDCSVSMHGNIRGARGGIGASTGNTITVDGTVTSTGTGSENHAVRLGGSGNTVQVGTVTVSAGTGDGIYVVNGGTVTVGSQTSSASVTGKGSGICTRQGSNTAVIKVYGDVTGGGRAISAYGDADIKVYGDVKSTSTLASAFAVEGFANSGDDISVRITGNVQGPNGVKYHGNNGTVSVGGNVTATGDASDTVGVYASYGSVGVTGNVASGGIGAEAGENGEITIDGVLTANTYVKVYYAIKTAADKEPNTTKEGYHTYQKNSAVVWIKDGASATTYLLTVQNGTGGGSYLSGTPVNITANPPAQGKVFDKWTTSNGGSFANADSTSTTFTMPSGDVIVTATYKDAPVATYAVTVNGSYAAVSGAGSYAKDAIVSLYAGNLSNYSFNGWTSSDVTITGPGNKNASFIMPQKNVTVTANWIYIGGGSGGGSTTPTTPTAPAYKADVKAGSGAEMTLPVTVDKDAGTASVDAGSQGLDQGGTIISIPSIPDVDTYSVGIPVPDLSTNDVQGTLTVNTDAGSVTVPSNMLTGVSGISGSKSQITIGQGDKSGLPEDIRDAIGDRPLVQLTLSIDGVRTDWSNSNAPVTVSISYTPTAAELANPESIVVWYIDGSGNAVSVPNGHYDPATGMVTFDTTHFSDYAVAYNKVSFKDVAESAWYSKAVGFIAAREITTGTGGGNFSPEARLTRGQFIVMLMKAYDIAPDANPKDNFSDAGGTYYTGYLAAAKRLGISAGIGNNMFAPEKEITRQEMFTLLYNALKVIGQLPQDDSGKTLSDFTDASQIDSWARDAMTLLVKTGTIGGNAGKLNPTSTTTRAEMAQVLYNLLSK